RSATAAHAGRGVVAQRDVRQHERDAAARALACTGRRTPFTSSHTLCDSHTGSAGCGSSTRCATARTTCDAAGCPTVWPVHRTAALRRRVAGVAPVGGGLFLLGISAYVVLGAAGHALAPRDYAAVASLYLLVAITSPGVFTALEQEVNREVSSRRAAGIDTRAVGRSGLIVGAGYAGLVAVVL